MKKFLIVFLLVLLCAELTLIISMFVIMTKATQGNHIAGYKNPQKALLVIDVQEDTTGSTALPLPYKGNAEYIAKLNKVIEAANKKNILIIYIQQEYESTWGKTLSWAVFGGPDIQGTPGVEVDKRVTMLSNYKFSKPWGDSFYNPKLDEFLTSKQVNELYLAGLDPEVCVYATARGALNRGYKVNVVTDAILSWRDSICVWTKNNNESIFKTYRQDGIKLISGKDI